MEELLKQILARLDNLNNDVKDLKPLVGQVKTLQEQVTRIETRIENDVSDKVRVLYDGYALGGDYRSNACGNTWTSVKTLTNYNAPENGVGFGKI